MVRDGRPIRVTATLAVEPVVTAGRRPGAVAGFLADRQQKADAYWASTFAPVVDPDGGDASCVETLDGP